MKVLLTGATGFIGSKITHWLIENGFSVLIIVRKKSNLSKISGVIDRLDIELLENGGLESILKRHNNINMIVHAATDYGIDGLSSISTYQTNLQLPMALLGFALINNINKFINLDTFYNSKKNNYEHLQSYVLSKRHFQEWGKHLSNEANISFVNLCLFHVYGEEDSAHKFVSTIIQRCQAGENIDLTAGLQKRDFIHVDDVVEAIGTVAKVKLNHGYHHFDVGTGETISIMDFVKMANRFCGNKAKLNFGALKTRDGEWKDICADPSSLISLGWGKKISIEKGLENLCNSNKAQYE